MSLGFGLIDVDLIEQSQQVFRMEDKGWGGGSVCEMFVSERENLNQDPSNV